MGNEQSQQSQPEVLPNEDVADNITSDSESETATAEKQAASSNQQAGLPPDQYLSPKKQRRKKSRGRKRLSSFEASTETNESTDRDATPRPTHMLPTRSESMNSGGSSHEGFNDVYVKNETPMAKNASTEDAESESRHKLETGPQSIVEVSASPSQKSVEQQYQASANGKGGRLYYPCPEAKVHGCTQTFNMMALAKQHAKRAHISSERLQCRVCGEHCSTVDAVRIHELSHSAFEPQMLHLDEANSGHSGTEVQVKDSDPGRNVVENSKMDDGQSADTLAKQGSTLNPLQVTCPTLDDIDKQGQALQEGISSMKSSQRIPDSELHESPNNGLLMTDVPEQSSDKGSTSIDSVFDEPVQKLIVEDTPRQARDLKRRSQMSSDIHLQAASNAPNKRQRRNVLSPPTSLTSDDQGDELERSQASLSSIKPGKLQKKTVDFRSGNLDNFAKPWLPGSQLRHPLLNPMSPLAHSKQRVQVAMSHTSGAGPSRVRSVKKVQQALDEDQRDMEAEEQPLANKKPKLAYSSPKGKQRAEPGMVYSSPSKGRHAGTSLDHRDNEGNNEDDKHRSGESASHGIATSVARRTQPRSASRKLAGSIKKSKNTAQDSGSSSSEDDTNAHDTTQPGKDIYLCQECHRKFSSRNALKKHEENPQAHKKINRCEECSLTFQSIPALREHQLKADHGDGTGYHGRKGAFSPREVDKLNSWRDRFCDEYDLDLTEFQQMMTDTLRRTKGFVWPHRFITKEDFLQEYYDILPNRNRRSMHRYRERAFQNVVGNQEWTKEDDDELVRLVKEIGTKWVEIGQRMTRTQDSVNQRWRHKLKYRGKAVDGEWLPQETEDLIKAVNLVRRESSLPLDPNTDVRIPWDLISNKLKGRRTAQQCSNKWRLLNTVKIKGRFVRAPGTGEVPNTPSSVITPSKMSQRLAGKTPPASTSKSTKTKPSPKRKHLSSERVTEPDSETSDQEVINEHTDDDQGSEAPAEPPETVQKASSTATGTKKKRKLALENGDQEGTETPNLSKRPFPVKTPPNNDGLSQIFDQTQANTSALRPTTTARKETQTERPSPNITIQRRPQSSPLQMIKAGMRTSEEDQDSSVSSDENDDDDDDEDEDEDDSDDDTGSADAIAKRTASETTASTSTSESAEDTGSEEDSSDDEVESTSSSRSTGVNAEDEHTVQDTGKESFLASLRSPPGQASSASSLHQAPLKRINWSKSLRGLDHATLSEEDSESGDDEGDIMHH